MAETTPVPLKVVVLLDEGMCRVDVVAAPLLVMALLGDGPGWAFLHARAAGSLSVPETIGVVVGIWASG